MCLHCKEPLSTAFAIWSVNYARRQAGTCDANSEPSPPLDMGRELAPAGCQGIIPALHGMQA